MIPPYEERFETLIEFLARIPAVRVNDRPNRGIGTGILPSGWWIKFNLDISHPLAWSIVQELGHVLNYLSLDERLPTVFKPVSPPPYLNGGPEQFLSWVIECSIEMSPAVVADWLQGRLPNPVDDPSRWNNN